MGWAWVVVIRDLVTLVADLIFRLKGVQGGEVYASLGEAGLVCLFGPGLTFLLVKSKTESLTSLLCAPLRMAASGSRAVRSSLRAPRSDPSAAADAAAAAEAPPPPPPHLAPVAGEAAGCVPYTVEPLPPAPFARGYSSRVTVEGSQAESNAALASRLRAYRRRLEHQQRRGGAEGGGEPIRERSMSWSQ